MENIEKLRIAIIDAEIVGKNKHRFPNLACMKISSFYKSQGNEVYLVYDWKDLYFDAQIWVDYEKAFSKYKKLYEKGLGIVCIDFDYADRSYGGPYPYWLNEEDLDKYYGVE